MISSFTDTKQFNYNSLMAGIKFDTYTAVKQRKMREKTQLKTSFLGYIYNKTLFEIILQKHYGISCDHTGM